MSCEHAETTTVLWLYGEADESHALHVAGCAECQDVSAAHVDVIAAAGDLRGEASLPAPANGIHWSWIAGFALVAAVLFAVLAPSTPGPADTGLRVAVAPTVSVPFDDLSVELDALDAELDELSFDLSAL